MLGSNLANTYAAGCFEILMDPICILGEKWRSLKQPQQPVGAVALFSPLLEQA